MFIHGQSLRLELDAAAVAGLLLTEIAGTANAVSAAAIEADLSSFDTDCRPSISEVEFGARRQADDAYFVAASPSHAGFELMNGTYSSCKIISIFYNFG